MDSIDAENKNNNKLLREDLQSLDKNILDFYGVVLDFDENGQQMAKTTKCKVKASQIADFNASLSRSYKTLKDYKKTRSISHH